MLEDFRFRAAAWRGANEEEEDEDEVVEEGAAAARFFPPKTLRLPVAEESDIPLDTDTRDEASVVDGFVGGGA